MAADPREFCLVHAADLHLGGRLWLDPSGLHPHFADRAAWADRLALRALVDLCLSTRAALLLLAGDVIDGWCRDHTVGLWLVHELLRLSDSSCQVLILLGNHDARTRVMRPLLLPGYARVLGLHGPETLVLERLGLALHGWSCPDVPMATDVALRYPEPLPGLLNIGLLHTSAEGRHGHVAYAPCSRRTLRNKGYDYWALGHVHQREVVSTDPWLVFPGNLQGRGPRESGSKGATLVRVRGGRVVGAEHRALDAVRFETVVADATTAHHFDEVLAASRTALKKALLSAQGRPLIARLIVKGIEGAACVLRVPPWERAAALSGKVLGLAPDSIWIQDAFIDAGPEAGCWSIGHAA